MTYSKELLQKMKVASALLEPPANDVVSELVDEISRLTTENDRMTAANKWVSVSEIKKTHSGNRVIIHMANDFIVFATYFITSDGSGYFRNDNGSLVAFEDVIEYMNTPLPTPQKDGDHVNK